jgi:hypothetical protein
LSGKAIEKPIATGAAQIGLAATAVRPPRGMGRIPRMGRRIVAQTCSVDVAQHRGSLRAARPVVAGPIFPGREGTAIRLGTSESIVTKWGVPHAWNHSAALRQRGLRVELVVVAVKIIDALCNNFSFKVLPGAAANAIARVDSRLSINGLRAQIGSPSFTTSTCSLCEFLTISVSALYAAEIGTLAWASAYDKKRHIRRLWCLLLCCRF